MGPEASREFAAHLAARGKRIDKDGNIVSDGMPVTAYAYGPFRVIPNNDTAHDEAFLIVDGESNVICPIWQKDVGEFFANAANWIIPCREIVRRLAEAEKWPDRMMVAGTALEIAEDAAKLWAKMQEDANGGGDGST